MKRLSYNQVNEITEFITNKIIEVNPWLDEDKIDEMICDYWLEWQIEECIDWISEEIKSD